MQSEAQTENVSDAFEPEGSTERQSPSARELKRERSTIDFPYLNLEECEEGAKELFRAAGTADVTHAQAASAMDQSATSSAFRLRLSAMRMFGLLDGEGGRLRLTPLGRSIAEAQTALDARVEAFLRIQLYQAVVQSHEGRTLPGARALETEFIQLGVAKKQAERARQVFDRSARHAGFLKQGSDRFVTPITQGKRPEAAEAEDDDTAEGRAKDQQQKAKGGSGGGGGDDSNLDPVIRALVQKLPPPGAPWTADDQVVWLRMMAMAFTMAYGGRHTISIKVDDPTRPAATV